MNDRQLKIVTAILTVLGRLDGGLLGEPLLHAESNLQIHPSASLAEFNDAVKEADAKGWLIGVYSRTTSKKLWSISDQGEAARLELSK